MEPRADPLHTILGMNPHLSLVLARQAGVIRARDHRHWRAQLYRQVDRGELTILYPGVFVLPQLAADPVTRIRAAAMWRPEAVVVGRAAARMTFWPDLHVDTIELAVPTRQVDRPGIHFQRRAVPPAWIWRWRRLQLSKPALTAIDLIPELHGAAISKALRSRVEYPQMLSALVATGHRRHQKERLRVVRAYRDEPWSEAEQVAHELLRSAKVTGWIANYPMSADGHLRFVDLVFEAQRVAIEIDGRAYHSVQPDDAESSERFETDRFVATTITAHGWRVLRITWRQLTERPSWVLACVRATLREADICAGQRVYRARKPRRGELTGMIVG